ncbi:gypsy/ty3 retroelement polyprotein [Tanacetum coccineum]
MVGTRTSSLEVQIDEATRNWVTNHVESIVGPMNERLKGIAASLAQLLNSNMPIEVMEIIDSVGLGRWNFLNKIKLVSIHLYDRALTWHLQFIKTHGEAVTWAEYEEVMLKRFGDANEDPMAEPR